MQNCSLFASFCRLGPLFCLFGGSGKAYTNTAEFRRLRSASARASRAATRQASRSLRHVMSSRQGLRDCELRTVKQLRDIEVVLEGGAFLKSLQYHIVGLSQTLSQTL